MKRKTKSNHFRKATKKVEATPPEEKPEAEADQFRGDTKLTEPPPEEEKKEETATATPPAPPAAAPVAGQNRMIWPGLPVTFNGGVCPNCGSSRNVIEKTGAGDLTTMGRARILRKHRCENCGWHFHTEQIVNAVDVPHIRMAKTPAPEW